MHSVADGPVEESLVDIFWGHILAFSSPEALEVAEDVAIQQNQKLENMAELEMTNAAEVS